MSSFKSNPFIDSLPSIHSYEAFEKLVERRPDKSEGFSQFSHEDREEHLEDLYVPSEFAWRIYQDITRLIRKGYRTRNPLDHSFTKHNSTWTFGDADRYSEEYREKRGIAGVVTGMSGFGKTTLADNCLSLIPKTRMHMFESSLAGEEFLQIVWVKIDCDADSRKETLLNIARQIQSHVKQDLGIKKFESMRAPALRKAVVTVCRKFAVGLIVIDECQTLTSLPFDKDDKTTSTEFLEKLYQDLGIPLLTIGTQEYWDLLRLRGQTYRRMTKNLSVRVQRYDEDDEFWSRLLNVYITNFVFPGAKPSSVKLSRRIYDISAGNVSLLQKLCSAMLLLRENSDVQKLTNDFLELAYQNVKTDVDTTKLLLELKDIDIDVPEMDEVNSQKSQKRGASKTGEPIADEAGEAYRNRILKLRGKK